MRPSSSRPRPESATLGHLDQCVRAKRSCSSGLNAPPACKVVPRAKRARLLGRGHSGAAHAVRLRCSLREIRLTGGNSPLDASAWSLKLRSYLHRKQCPAAQIGPLPSRAVGRHLRRVERDDRPGNVIRSPIERARCRAADRARSTTLETRARPERDGFRTRSGARLMAGGRSGRKGAAAVRDRAAPRTHGEGAAPPPAALPAGTTKRRAA